MSFLELKKLKLKTTLALYKKQVDQFIFDELSKRSSQSKLNEAALYALEGSGKRFRPAITVMVAKLLNNGLDVRYSALAIELFHTASLVADDLPCMDDDSKRRNKQSLHIAYGEDTALLTSYALIGEGYQCLFKNKKVLEGKLNDLNERSFIALSMLAKSNSLDGVPKGQHLDLYPGILTKEKLDEIFYKKTVLFFEVAFALGWLFGGGEITQMGLLKKASHHFGMAFQIYDDFCDIEQDQSKGKKVNYPLFLGEEKGRLYLEEHLSACKESLEKLGLYQSHFKELLEFLQEF